MASKEVRDAAQRLKDAIHKDSHYPAGWIANTNLCHGHFEQTLDVIIADTPTPKERETDA